MSYRDITTGISIAEQGANYLGFLQAVPGLGGFVSLLEDIAGAFIGHSETERYNAMINQYYATPVSQGGGLNYGTRSHSYSSVIRSRRRHFHMVPP